jgi:hypothetical protein
MIRSNPPRWLERSLMLLLHARDRETVSGDLLEVYREDKLPEVGRVRANAWYARQILSLAPHRLRSLPGQPRLLALFCIFTALSGTWLGIMDQILKHPADREIISGTIVTQAVLTLVVLGRPQRGKLRIVALGGTAGILYLGIGALIGVLTGSVFEGYILLIALGLIIQALLTILTFARRSAPPRVRIQPL